MFLLQNIKLVVYLTNKHNNINRIMLMYVLIQEKHTVIATRKVYLINMLKNICYYLS